MNKELTSIKEHKVSPIIMALEKHEEPVIEMQGYLGSSKNGSIRLHRELDTSSYLEIPKQALVYMDEPEDGKKGKVRVFVLDSHKLTEVIKHNAIAFELSLKKVFENDAFPPVERIKTFWTCAAQCEGKFVDLVVQILLMERRALQEDNPVKRDLLLAQADQLKHQAKSALLFCLNICGDEHRVPAFWWILDEDTGGYRTESFTIPKYHASLIAKHLEKLE